MFDDKKSLLREEYISRINRVQDYIEANLSEEFSLIKLSEIANFSPYHFHRIFSMFTGETLFQYIQRVRLEKAAFFLAANPKDSITKIALDCGFANQASFAKAFKKYFNMTASGMRAESNIGKVSERTLYYNGLIRNKQCSAVELHTDIPFTVDVMGISDMNVVYIRHTGPYKKDAALFNKLFGKLFRWAESKGLGNASDTRWLTLCHDKPDLTDDHKLRVSVCMTAPLNVKIDGEVGRMVIPGGKYAVGHFELDNDQYQDAWWSMTVKWLPESGYQPDDRLSFELYLRDPKDGSEGRQLVDIYIPIRPL